MDFFKKSSVKFKYLTFDELVVNLERLSRFRLPEESYSKVFGAVILKCLIYPKYSKKDIELLNPDIISKLVKQIWNESVKKCCTDLTENSYLHYAKKLITKKTFKNIDERTKIFINTKLLISPVLKKLDYGKADINLKFLIKLNEEIKNKEDAAVENLQSLRYKYGLMFPVERILIVEGITEETLLPVFAEKLNKSFEKNGVFVLSAGGKSKSLSLYLKLKEKIKIPIVLLFDFDAQEILKILNNVLAEKDKAVIITQGEFEDILSANLIKRALNKEYETASPIVKDDLHIYNKMCDNIACFYKSRNLGEFKKAKFSKIIAQNIKYDTDITDEIKNIIFNLI